MNERIDHDKLESQEVRRIGSLPLSLPQTQRLTAPCESVIIDCNGRSLQVDLVRRGRTVPVAGCVAS